MSLQLSHWRESMQLRIDSALGGSVSLYIRGTNNDFRNCRSFKLSVGQSMNPNAKKLVVIIVNQHDTWRYTENIWICVTLFFLRFMVDLECVNDKFYVKLLERLKLIC